MKLTASMSCDSRNRTIFTINGSISNGSFTAIYEKLLKTCLMDNSRIKDLQFVMDNVDDKNVIPEDFRKLYEVFIGAMGDQI